MARQFVFKPGILKIISVRTSVCMYVCPPPRLLITNDVLWCDMDPIWLVKQVLQLLRQLLSVSLVGVTFELKYAITLTVQSFKQLYISNKTDWFSYKVGGGVYGVTHIEHWKAELTWAIDKRVQVISNIMLFIAVIPLRNWKIKLF